MAIEVRKKDRETTGALLRRFTRRVQQSGILIQARKDRFYKKPRSKRQIKEGALRREEIKKLRDKMIKIGLLEEGQLIPKEQLKKISKKWLLEKK